MFFILCELVIHFFVAVYLQKTDNTFIIHQPLGFQMCLELCSTFERCQSPKYDLVQLRCTLEITTVKSRSCGDVQPSTKTCTIKTIYSRTIHARKKGVKKVTRTWKVSRDKRAETRGTSLAQRPSGHLMVYTTTTTGNPLRLMTSKKKEETSLVPRPSGHLTVYTTTRNPLRLTTSEKKKEVTCPGELDVVERNTTIHQACEDGKLCVVKFMLLQRQDDINMRDKVGRTPVMAAAGKGQVAVYDFLVSNGCDLSFKDDNNDTVLHLACEGGHVGIVSNLVVNQKCDAEIKGRHGWTPVMVSVFFGFINVFDLLVRRSCNITIVDELMCNILHVSCMGGHVDMVKYILSKEIYNIESKGEMGRTSVLIAAYYGHREVVRLLMTYGCKQSAVDYNRDNILHVACLGGHVDMVKDILTLNITNIESRGQYGETPVIRAAGRGHIAVVDFLAKKGCNLKAVNDYMMNILHAACSYGHADMVKQILLQYKLDVEGRGHCGRTPVMFAAYHGQIEVVKILVAKGCDFEKVDSKRDNILHLACIGGHVDMVKHILSMKTFSIDSRGEYGRTAAMKAAIFGHVEVLKYLDLKGSKLTLIDSYGSDILHLACSYGHIDIVKYILSQQIIGIDSRDRVGRTPVLEAAMFGELEMIKYLVHKRCKFTLTDFEGNNILHLACFGDHVNVAKYVLLVLKINIESRGQNGLTPVMTAAFYGKKGVFDFIVNHGSKLTVIDNYKNNLLHVACMGGNIELVKYLLTLRYAERMKRATNIEGKTPLKIAEQKRNEGVVALLKGGM